MPNCEYFQLNNRVDRTTIDGVELPWTFIRWTDEQPRPVKLRGRCIVPALLEIIYESENHMYLGGICDQCGYQVDAKPEIVALS